MNLKVSFTVVVCLFIVSGCATYQSNPKLEKVENIYSVVQKAFTDNERSDELFFVLTFSGGGTRAAAMSYGILEALDKVEIPKQSKSTGSKISNWKLLDEVDMISSVSGGSFTAAYFGLYGRKAFEDYPDRFLYRKVQSELLWRLFNPFRWPKLMSPNYNRSELAADYYDKILFEGKLLGDINNSYGPAILIQATDITEGYIFSFTPYFFNLICSSLDDLRVSRAVAASSSYPGAFSGISLQNYAGQCGYHPEPWIYELLQKNDTLNFKYRYAMREMHLISSEEKNYIHLYDGAVGDNLGLRGPFISLVQLTKRGVDLEKIGLSKTKRVVFIIVNAQITRSKDKKIFDLVPATPNPSKSIRAALDTVMNNSNFDTLYTFQNYLAKNPFQEQTPDNDVKPVKYDVIHINFQSIENKDEREFFEKIPTTLQLKPEIIDRLRKKAGELLYESEQFQQFLSDLGGHKL